MPVSVGSHNDLYAKRRAARILATALDPAFLRVKLDRLPLDVFMVALGGFSNTSSPAKNRRWTEDDSALLRQLWSQGMKRAEMAKRMKRSLFLIYRYAWEMSLPRVRAPR